MHASGTAVAPATEIDGYRVERLVARGGFGEVYRVIELASGQPVALKIMHADLCGTPSAVARFLREAEVMARVRHPHVVELRGAGVVDDGRPYLAMEWLAGTDLARVLAEQGRLPPARALAVLEPVAGALAAAHAASIIHRDVKASNVFLADEGGRERVVLIDFGVAKLAAAGVLDLTTSRQIVGTPLTMAPEQVAGGAVDVRTDVYGLGVLAFHLLTGRLPFEDESATVVQYLHVHARRPKVSALAPVAPAVDDVVARAMAIEPGPRFADPVAFVAALRDALGERAAGEVALEPRPAVGVLVEVRADPDALADPDDALVADVAELLALAEEELAAAGLAPVVQGGNLVLYGRASDRPSPAIAAAGAPGLDPAAAATAATAATAVAGAPSTRVAFATDRTVVDPAAAPSLVAARDDASARTAAARAEVVALARTLAATLAARPGADPRVGFVVVAHAATALFAGDALRAGELTDLTDWLPDPDVRGAVATRAALDGLPVLGATVSDSRVRAV